MMLDVINVLFRLAKGKPGMCFGHQKKDSFHLVTSQNLMISGMLSLETV
jgi:hypothetical protein